MAAPITFRNVSSTVDAGALADLGESAAKLFDKGARGFATQFKDADKKQLTDAGKLADDGFVGKSIEQLRAFDAATAASTSRLTAGEFDAKRNAAITSEQNRIIGQREFAATGRAEENRLQQVAGENSLNSVIDGRRERTVAANTKIFGSFAQEKGLTTDASGGIDFNAPRADGTYVTPEEQVGYEAELSKLGINRTGDESAAIEEFKLTDGYLGFDTSEEKNKALENFNTTFENQRTKMSDDNARFYASELAEGTAVLDRQIQYSQEAIDTTFSLNPTEAAETARREGLSLGAVIARAVQVAPDSSFFGGLGGQGLRDKITEMYTAGAKPWQIELAMLSSAENEEETIVGDRTVDTSNFDSVLEALMNDESADTSTALYNRAKKAHRAQVENKDQSVKQMKATLDKKYKKGSAGDRLLNRVRDNVQAEVGSLQQYEVSPEERVNRFNRGLARSQFTPEQQAILDGTNNEGGGGGGTTSIVGGTPSQNSAYDVHTKYQAMPLADKLEARKDPGVVAQLRAVQQGKRNTRNIIDIRQDAFRNRDLGFYELQKLKENSPEMYEKYVAANGKKKKNN
jgi:hypothetical protein